MTLAFVEAEPLTGGVDGFTGIPFPPIGALDAQGAGRAVLARVGRRGRRACFSRPTWSRCGPAARCARCTAASSARRHAASTSSASRCARSWSPRRSPGLSGALYAPVVGFISPSVFTLSASVTFLAMAVIGGSGSLAGPVAAAIVLTLVQYLDALVPGISRETAQAGAGVRGRHLRSRHRARRAVRARRHRRALQARAHGRVSAHEPACGQGRDQALRRSDGRRQRLLRRVRRHDQGAHRPERRGQVDALQRAHRLRPARRGLRRVRRDGAGGRAGLATWWRPGWRARSRTRSCSRR